MKLYEVCRWHIIKGGSLTTTIEANNPIEALKKAFPEFDPEEDVTWNERDDSLQAEANGVRYSVAEIMEE